jgi:Transposase IS4
VQETALKPIAVGHLAEAVELDEKALSELPTYIPTLDLRYQLSESLVIGFSELHMFQKLLTPAIIDRIVAATNSYAKNARKDEELLPFTRPWISVNTTDIWRFIGCLLHIGYHRLSNHTDY